MSALVLVTHASRSPAVPCALQPGAARHRRRLLYMDGIGHNPMTYL